MALIGPDGIGRTSIARTVIYNNRIREQFGDNRRFIRCDQFPASRLNFLSRLSTVIGARVHNPEDDLAPSCHSCRPRRFCLPLTSQSRYSTHRLFRGEDNPDCRSERIGCLPVIHSPTQPSGEQHERAFHKHVRFGEALNSVVSVFCCSPILSPQQNACSWDQLSIDPTVSQLIPTRWLQIYGPTSTYAVGHANTEAGPSTLLPPPDVGLPTQQTPGGISEMTADATNNHQTTEECEAPVSSFHRSHTPHVPDDHSTSEVKAEKDRVPPQAITELPQ